MLRDASNISEDGHEIRIPFPAWDNMEMKVLVDSSTGGGTEIKANVESVGVHQSLEYGSGFFQPPHEVKHFIFDEVFQ